MLSPAGLTHTPRSEKAEMSFNPKEMETYLPYTRAMKAFLAKYEEETQKDQMKFEDCGGRFYSDASHDLPASPWKVLELNSFPQREWRTSHVDKALTLH